MHKNYIINAILHALVDYIEMLFALIFKIFWEWPALINSYMIYARLMQDIFMGALLKHLTISLMKESN